MRCTSALSSAGPPEAAYVAPERLRLLDLTPRLEVSIEDHVLLGRDRESLQLRCSALPSRVLRFPLELLNQPHQVLDMLSVCHVSPHPARSPDGPLRPAGRGIARAAVPAPRSTPGRSAADVSRSLLAGASRPVRAPAAAIRLATLAHALAAIPP